MGGVADLAAALAVLGDMKVREAPEEDRKYRQAEAFVPFILPQLPQRGRTTRQPATEAEPHGAVGMSASDVWSNT
jgi:hypothetical protein